MGFGEYMVEQGSDSKATVIGEMFARIAPRYDFMNRLMSLGQDGRWRRAAASLAGVNAGLNGRMVDIATGTGELALELAKHVDSVVGLDLCPQMVSRGQAKVVRKGLEQRIDFILGDALALPFADDAFDCALTSFALRNVADVPCCLAEMRRVVKPSGRVVCLELIMPKSRIIGGFYRFYLYRIVPFLGRWITGDSKAYSYLPDSISCFLSPDEFQKTMEGIGLRQVSYKCLNLGTIAIHSGVK